MTYIKPAFRHPDLQKNKIGYLISDYEGALSTLCAGCGHDSISVSIIQACYELSIPPHQVAKVSGIGCSSKTPTYFLGNSHGFNSVHGRMPSVTTGANMANKDLIYLGVSGDGDSASIGMGQFVHAIRRNVNMVYIVMNNGCYGLTKGQDSATADFGSIGKSKVPTPFQSIDLVGLCLELGGTFVSRSFSGDKNQLVPLIKAGISHPGFALIDVVSPCVTFNNTPTSTKSYSFVREHMEATGTIDYVPEEQEISVDYEAGSSSEVTLFDGSSLSLEKLSGDWDPQDKMAALKAIKKSEHQGKILTGLIYIDPECDDLHKINNTVDTPLNQLKEKDLCPGNDKLQLINQGFR